MTTTTAKATRPAGYDPRVTVKELAQELRVSPTYVKDHAQELGGVKVKGQWRFFVDEARDRLLEIWPQPE